MTPAPHRGSSGDKNKPRGGSSGGYGRLCRVPVPGGPSRSAGAGAGLQADRRASYDDRPPRTEGDRGERAPRRSFDDRPPRTYGDRPQRSYGDRPQGDRPQRSYGDRPQGGQGRPSG